MSTQLEEAMKAGREDRAIDVQAEEAKRAERDDVRKTLLLKERALVKAGKYDLFGQVRKATRAQVHSFTMSGSTSDGRGWSPSYAEIVGDAIRAEHPEFTTLTMARDSRDMCETRYDEGVITVMWRRT